MRVVMISDVHLTGLDDPRQDQLVRLLDALDADALYLLGDVFHHWWGFRGEVPSAYGPVCAALERLAGRGVGILVVPGNHDFALGPFFHETLRAEVRGAHLRELDGQTWCLAHGDEADRSLGYRLLRAVLRGRAFGALMGALGPRRGMRLLEAMAGASRDRPASQEWLLAAQREWAQARIREGARVVVLGHSHAPGMTALDGGSLINLGDWRDGPRWLEVVDGVPSLRHLPARP